MQPDADCSDHQASRKRRRLVVGEVNEEATERSLRSSTFELRRGRRASSGHTVTEWIAGQSDDRNRAVVPHAASAAELPTATMIGIPRSSAATWGKSSIRRAASCPAHAAVVCQPIDRCRSRLAV